MVGWLRPALWVGAIILFILGGYSDTNWPEMMGWGFALLTAGFLVKHLPGGGGSES
jgi:hypothetical protein